MQDQREQTPEETFARRMRQLRDTEGIAQTVLAERLEHRGIKLDGTAITRMERGTRTIRLNEAVAVAAALDVSVDEMLHPAPSPDEQLEQARQHAEHAEWAAMLAVAEYDAARARLARLKGLAPADERARLKEMEAGL